MSNAIQIITPDIINPMIPAYNKPDAGQIVAMCQLASNAPDLAHCTPDSVRQSIQEAVSFGLSPLSQNGQCYFIAYAQRDSAYKFCKMVIGYRGMIQIAAREGWMINAELVYDGEEFSVEMFNARQSIKHKRNPFGAGKIVGAYATAYHIDRADTLQIETASIEEINKAQLQAKKKANNRNTAWDDWADEMRKKFCIRRLWKKLPLSLEMQRVEAAIVSSEDEEPTSIFTSSTAHQVDAQPLITQEFVVEPDAPVDEPETFEPNEEPVKINGYVCEPMTADEKERNDMQRYIGSFPVEKLNSAQIRNLKRSGGEIVEGVLYFSDKSKIPAAYRYLRQLGIHFA